MYSACGNLGSAQQLFDEMPQPDLPSWNSIVHANAKVVLVDIAQQLFDRIPDRNVASWSCMLDGYVKCGKYIEALALFREMQALQVDDFRGNEFTMSVVISACAQLGALEHGKRVHANIDKCGIEVEVALGTSLIDMYDKCGSIDWARWVFRSLGPCMDVMAWTAMILALAMHGHCQECLDLFSEMTNHGVRPSAMTFLGVLWACVRSGLVDEGEKYFRNMSRGFAIAPEIQHYGCMVDLYARAGLMEKAWTVVDLMPMDPDVLVLGALLNGSRMHGDIETCELAIKKLIELEPTNSGAYRLLSNAYGMTGKWKNARDVRDMMKAKGVREATGCSFIEVGGFIHEFVAGDKSHPDTREIHMMLVEIVNRLKLEGYVANTEEVLLDLDEEGKEVLISNVRAFKSKNMTEDIVANEIVDFIQSKSPFMGYP